MTWEAQGRVFQVERANLVTGQYLPLSPILPDLFFDDLYCLAAKRRYMSCERLVPTEELLREGSIHTLRINRMMTDGVGGAAGSPAAGGDPGTDGGLLRSPRPELA